MLRGIQTVFEYKNHSNRFYLNSWSRNTVFGGHFQGGFGSPQKDLRSLGSQRALGLWSSRSWRLDLLRLVRQAHGGVTAVGKSPLESTSQCNDPHLGKSGKTVVNGSNDWVRILNNQHLGLMIQVWVTFQLCCCLKHLKDGLPHGYSFLPRWTSEYD